MLTGWVLASSVCAYAGSRTDFLRQKSSDIFWRAFFGRGISGEALLVYNFVPSNWLWSGFINPPPPFGFFPFPRKESFDLNRKKKAPKKRTRFGRKFPPEWVTNSSLSISRDYLITENRATFCAQESCSGQKFLSRKKLSRKYRSIFASKISPATGVRLGNSLAGSFRWF